MVFTKKFDRAFQWAGEKMGGEAKTTHSDDFKTLETEMTTRQEGADRLQKSMTGYVKWLSRRCDNAEDKERGTPASLLGRTMASHGEEFEPDSDVGNCLVSLGRANERIANFQENYVEQATITWLENLERTVAMMKEYSAGRKKLENRRLAFDASTARMSKARREDFRVEEEVRTNRAKFEESEEDVYRRMQDIKEADGESASALTEFLDAQLEYHERAAEELRRVKQQWSVTGAGSPGSNTRPYKTRSRSNTARSRQETFHTTLHEEQEPMEEVPRLPTRPSHVRPAPQPPRPMVSRAATCEGRLAPTPLTHVPQVPALPLSRVHTDRSGYARGGAYGGRGSFGYTVDDDDASSEHSSGSSPHYTRSASPATSYGSLSRSASAVALKKAPPPPPPVNRAKKPPPPPPSRKPTTGY